MDAKRAVGGSHRHQEAPRRASADRGLSKNSTNDQRARGKHVLMPRPTKLFGEQGGVLVALNQ
jgi:hypothetical protein